MEMIDFLEVLHCLNKTGNALVKISNEVQKIHLKGFEELFSQLDDSGKDIVNNILFDNETKYKRWSDIHMVNRVLDNIYNILSDVFGKDFDWEFWSKLLHSAHAIDNRTDPLLESNIYSIVAFGDWDIVHPVLKVLYENTTLKN